MRILRSTIARLPSPCNQKSPLLQCRGGFFYLNAIRGHEKPAPSGRRLIRNSPKLLYELAADLAIGKFGTVDIDVHFSGLEIGKLGVSQST